MSKILRKLKTSDIFKLSKILKKMNMKKELDLKDKTQEEVGAEMIITIFENLHMAEDEVGEFLGSLANMTKKEFSELEMDKVMEIISEFKEMSGIASFLKSASR